MTIPYSFNALNVEILMVSIYAESNSIKLNKADTTCMKLGSENKNKNKSNNKYHKVDSRFSQN